MYLTEPPRAAYLHVPFCAHRCGYCDFTVIAGRGDLVEDYLRAIAMELASLGKPRPVDTLFVGGGTPTQLPPEKLAEFLSLTGSWFELAAGGEFTVEANPADITGEVIDVLLTHGINRLSLGAQSFDSSKLAALERDHDAQQIRHVVEMARSAGLTNISLDLIFAAPSETLETWQADLDSAIELDVPHVSTYGLTYEKGTAFDVRRLKEELTPADEELERTMYLAAIDRLTAAGLEHYEVSNFAHPARRCRHNETYWTGREYFAAGPGAARYIDGARETNHRSVTTWLKRVLDGQSPVAEREMLSPEDRARERLVFGLRRLDGVDLEQFAKETGFTADNLAAAPLAAMIENGWLTCDDTRLRLTREGLLVSDSLWPQLL